MGKNPEEPFKPHPNLSDDINRKIEQAEIQGGAHLERLPIGKGLKVRTENNTYIIQKIGPQEYTIQGHPEICPEPISAKIHGSSWGGGMLKRDFLGRGLRMEFYPETGPNTGRVVTSEIQEVTEI